MEMLLIFLHCVNAFKEIYDVKIEFKSSNETIFNEFSITLDKINNYIAKDSINSEPKLKTNIINTNKYSEIAPLIQRNRNNDEIKHELDNFVLQRKQSHLTTVRFNFKPNINPEYAFVKNKEEKRDIKEMDRFKDRKDFNEEFKKKYIRELETNKISQEVNLNIYQRPEIEEVLKKQNFLVGRIMNLLKEEKKTLRTNFNTLLQEMDKLKNENVTHKQEVIQGSIKPATVVNIDETMVREALKKDPFVRRVLQMGKSKRDAYKKEARAFNKG
ncbi:uncharacterized protein LOC110998851 [Pieris rapae]|uniref:uncharacterized protein LOC110998851 n=1 Tax=Pieris rapae TaxID=64459 RepID=UPI001E27F2D1|nr:uncharacterized protein LOC110998851 [Pieris rapae]